MECTPLPGISILLGRQNRKQVAYIIRLEMYTTSCCWLLLLVIYRAHSYRSFPRSTKRGRTYKGLQASYKVTLIHKDEKQVIDCRDNEFILEAAERVNIDLPFSCRAGSKRLI